jgi:hypothetical protein
MSMSDLVLGTCDNPQPWHADPHPKSGGCQNWEPTAPTAIEDRLLAEINELTKAIAAKKSELSDEAFEKWIEETSGFTGHEVSVARAAWRAAVDWSLQ